MILEQGLFDHLKHSVNASIYAQLRGEKLPAVVYTLISDPVFVSLPGVEQVHETRYQIDCYHRKYVQVKALAQKVINTLHRQTGDMGGFPVQRVLLENRQDGFDDKSTLHRQILSFVIYH